MDLSFLEGKIVAGCDEAGRGCLAGPVVAASVILPEGLEIPGLKDSKKINEKKRFELREIILEKAVAYGIAACSPEEIDEINILNASILAMQKSLDLLTVRPELIVVDGNRFKPYHDIPYKTIVKGDDLVLSISAASILAKTERDLLMEQLHTDFPMYNWKKNKGYPTADHRDGIREHGTSIHHRKSFRQLPAQLSLF